jgi:hypothetical protein
MPEADHMPLPAPADAEGSMRSMHKGRAGSLVLMGALLLALLGGLAFLVGGDDQARVYGELGRQINGLKHAAFDQFWGCALQGENIADIKSNSELMAQVGGRAEERGRAYGVHVRDACLSKLEGVGPQLESLIVPQDLQADVAALKQASGELRSAWSNYVAYLDNPELDYQEREAQPYLQHIARGWYDFKRAHAAVNKTIKSRLK